MRGHHQAGHHGRGLRRAGLRAAVPAALATGVLLASCAGEGDRFVDGADSAAPGTDGTLVPVTVGAMPIVDVAPLHLGLREGIFAEHGLDVEVVQAQGGAAIVPAVVGGAHDFGFSNVVSLLVATARGLDLRIVSPASASSGDPGADLSGVLTQPGSGIENPGDLAGRTVAVNTLHNIGEVTLSHLVARDGGDPAAVEYVEMPFPEMPARLREGEVDAVWISEPFLTISLGEGAELVVHDYATVDPEMMIDAYFTTAEYAAERPEVVEAFAAAMAEALALAEADPAAARAVLTDYTEMDPELVERISMPRFPPEPNPASLELMAELALEHGVLPAEVDTASLLPTEP